MERDLSLHWSLFLFVVINQHLLNRTVLTLLLFLAGLTRLSAQLAEGRVVDAGTGKGLYPVTIVNLKTQESTYTDEVGDFELPAAPGDKLAFAYIGYKTIQKTVPSAGGVVTWRIDMTPLNYQLNEVLVRPKYTQYQIDSIKRQSTYQRPLARVKGGSIMSPVSLLAEKLSRRSKQIERFQKDFRYFEKERFIDTRYTPELVQSLTDLSGDTLANFMNAYPMPYDYARAASDLELKMWIRTNFRDWLFKQQQQGKTRK